MFSAYTLRKALPRQIKAVVLIQLSWFLSVEIVKIVNNISHGIEGLMYAPFGGIDKFNLGSTLSGTNQGLFSALTVGGGLAVFGTSVAVGSGSLLGILAMAVTAVAGLLIALFALVLRRAILIALIVIAPLALVMWILPGTERLWKIWWESFTKLLIMYPLIIFVIAAGRIFAYTAARAGGTNQLAVMLMVVIGFFGPFFMIPAIFRIAGAAFTFVTGTLNNRSKGLFDRMRNIRAGEAEKNKAAFKAGQRFKGTMPGTKRIAARTNRMSHGLMMGPGNAFGLGERGRIAADETLATQSEALVKTEKWQGAMYKDDVMRALTYRNANEAAAGLRARGMAEDDIRSTLISANRIGFGRSSQIAAVNQMAANKTGYDNAVDAMDTVQRVSNGNTALEGSLRERVKFTSKQVGRNDMGSLTSRQAGESDQQWNDRMTAAGFENVDTYSLGREHAKSYKNMAESNSRQYQEAVRAYSAPGGRTSANREAVIASRTRLEEMIKNASSATGNNARQVVDTATGSMAGADEVVRRIDPEILGVQELPRDGQGISQGQVGSGGLARAYRDRGYGMDAGEIARRNEKDS